MSNTNESEDENRLSDYITEDNKHSHYIHTENGDIHKAHAVNVVLNNNFKCSNDRTFRARCSKALNLANNSIQQLILVIKFNYILPLFQLLN